MTGKRRAMTLSPESLAEIRIVFFQECETHLAQIEAGLTAMQDGAGNAETIDTVHRAVHSIKGAAGIFELDALVAFSRQFETILAEVRADRLRPDPPILGVFQRASEVLADLVEAGRREDRAARPDRAAPLMAELAALSPREAEPSASNDLDFEPRPMAFRPLGGA